MFTRTIVTWKSAPAVAAVLHSNNLVGIRSTLGLGSARGYCINYVKNSGFVKVDGLKLHWERIGRGPNVAIALPGLLGSYKDSLQIVAEKMNQETFTVIGWDPPGYGKSRPPNRDFLHPKLEACRVDADLAAKLMQQLLYKRYSILGVGQGGRTGVMMAAKYPDRISKLVICGTPKLTDEMRVMTVEELKDLENWPATRRRKLKETYEADYLTQVLEDFDKYTKDEFRTQKHSKLYEKDLAKIRTPTMIIYGDHDTVVGPKHATEHHKAIADSRLHKVKGGCHDDAEAWVNLPETTKFLLS